MLINLLNKFKSVIPSISNVYKPCNCLQSRQYAARKGKRAKMLAEKMKRKQEEALKPKPQQSQLLRKTSAKPENERKRIIDDNYFDTPPIDNVWRTALYRGKPYSFEEGFSMLREVCDPSILNEPDAFVYATVEFDLRTKKKEQYLSEFNGVLTYPHTFESGMLNKVIVICKQTEDQMDAIDAGAIYSGGSTLVKQIISGQIMKESFDYVICHPDSLKDITPLRTILKKNFPNPYNGLLRLDLRNAVPSFMSGVKYNLQVSSIEADFGWVDSTFGRLNMPLQDLQNNFKYLLNTLEKQRPQGVQNVFVTRSELWCSRSMEHFKVQHGEYLPGYLESEEAAIEQ